MKKEPLAIATLLAMAASLSADPGAPSPPCGTFVDAFYCIRATDYELHPLDPDRYCIELEFINWTGQDVYGIEIWVTSETSNPVGDVPYISNAYFDDNGRPLCGCPPVEDEVACPAVPTGPFSTKADWEVTNLTDSKVRFQSSILGFGFGDPIPHPQVTTASGEYHGLLDPALPGAPDCPTVITMMIPGSQAIPGTPTQFVIPDLETVDDGENVLDGFVLEIDRCQDGGTITLNWFFLDANGSAIGSVAPGGWPVLGDAFGFGGLNTTCVVVPGDPRPSAERHGSCTGADRLTPGSSVDTSFWSGLFCSPWFGCNVGPCPGERELDPSTACPRVFAEEIDPVTGIKGFPIFPKYRGSDAVFLVIEPSARTSAFPLVPMDAVLPDGFQPGVNFFSKKDFLPAPVLGSLPGTLNGNGGPGLTGSSAKGE